MQLRVKQSIRAFIECKWGLVYTSVMLISNNVVIALHPCPVSQATELLHYWTVSAGCCCLLSLASS